MPFLKTKENNNVNLRTKWYNNNYEDAYLVILKYALVNNAILLENNKQEQKMRLQVGFRDILVIIQNDELGIGIDLEVKTTLFKSNKFVIRFYEEIGQFLKER